VILDGSTAVTGWTLVSGTVWRATATFTPIAVVVNEVPLKQVRQGQGGSTAPQDGLAGVTSGSGKWHVDYTTRVITADFGTTIGSGNPNTADIVVPSNDGGQYHVFFGYDVNRYRYYTFQGLTIRGSGSNGIWGSANNIVVDHCDIKFNGKAAVSYQFGADNSVTNTHAYHNVLLNWPRGNNGFAEAGGGWAGSVVWSYNMRPVARGNIVHRNGGEGIITYGTQAGGQSGTALFEQNVSYDNWSVNMYFDNQPDNTARQNFLFAHPLDMNDFLYVGTTYPYNAQGRGTVCLMLADEQGSSDSTNGYANLRGTKVYNNIIAGCRIGIRDYSEGTQAQANHGLKDTLIVNNTIIMAYYDFPNADTFGIYLQDNQAPSGTQRNSNTLIQNNVVHGFNQDAVLFSAQTGALGGINLDYNVYYSAATKPFGSGYNTVTFYNFTGWKAATPGADANSRFQDPLFVDLVEFRTAGSAAWDYARADVAAGSPTLGTGAPQAFSPAVNFRLAPRSSWNVGAF
jgi:hypothetical protein